MTFNPGFALQFLEGYVVAAAVLYFIAILDLPATAAMKRWEIGSFLAGTPLMFLFFTLCSPVLSVFLIRELWLKFRTDCAYRRLTDRLDDTDQDQGDGGRSKKG